MNAIQSGSPLGGFDFASVGLRPQSIDTAPAIDQLTERMKDKKPPSLQSLLQNSINEYFEEQFGFKPYVPQKKSDEDTGTVEDDYRIYLTPDGQVKVEDAPTDPGTVQAPQ